MSAKLHVNPVSTHVVRSPWQIHRRVIFTVFLRELGYRFGRYRAGYVWAVLEPLAMITTLSIIRSLMSRHDIGGLPYPLFFAAGIVPFQFFQHILSTCANSIEANMGIFNYRQVKPIDPVIARIMLELLISTTTGTLIMVGLWYFGVADGYTWNDTLPLVLAIFCLLLFASGLGLVCAILGPLWQDAKKIIPLMVRPIFFISGIFFAASDVPEPYLSYLKWNPLLHVIELIRGSMFVEYQSHEGSFAYLLPVSMITFFFGLSVFRCFRKTVITSGNIR